MGVIRWMWIWLGGTSVVTAVSWITWVLPMWLG